MPSHISVPGYVGYSATGPKIDRGKVHEYLGMDMDWIQDKTMIVYMIKYIQKVINNFPEVIKSTADTPASEHLLQVRDEKDRKFLLEEQAQHFYHTFAQLLFLCMIEFPDIQPLVSFLTTRVISPDEDDSGKLKRGLKYLKGTLYMKLYLSEYELNIFRWWVNTSYGTHWDCRSHIRAVMSMGKGAIMSLSRNKKLNTASSTEA